MDVSSNPSSQLQRDIQEALHAPFSGWDFSRTEAWGTVKEPQLPWDYRQSIQEKLPTTRRMVDLGTGGGEFLSSLSPLPLETFATESYPPNVEIARKRLSNLGITVVRIDEGIQERYPLPFGDGEFDLVIDRHEAYDSREAMRIVKSGGYFITQQVGGRNLERLRTIFGTLQDEDLPFAWDIATATKMLRQAGFVIKEQREISATCQFPDIRTVIYHLKALPWNFPHFEADADRQRLENVAFLLRRDGYFEDVFHRFFVVAHKIE